MSIHMHYIVAGGQSFSAVNTQPREVIFNLEHVRIFLRISYIDCRFRLSNGYGDFAPYPLDGGQSERTVFLHQCNACDGSGWQPTKYEHLLDSK
jgi:hypothetical protein